MDLTEEQVDAFQLSHGVAGGADLILKLILGFRAPRGLAVALQGPRGSRGSPTRSQGSRGRPSGSQGVRVQVYNHLESPKFSVTSSIPFSMPSLTYGLFSKSSQV